MLFAGMAPLQVQARVWWLLGEGSGLTQLCSEPAKHRGALGSLGDLPPRRSRLSLGVSATLQARLSRSPRQATEEAFFSLQVMEKGQKSPVPLGSGACRVVPKPEGGFTVDAAQCVHSAAAPIVWELQGPQRHVLRGRLTAKRKVTREYPTDRRGAGLHSSVPTWADVIVHPPADLHLPIWPVLSLNRVSKPELSRC